MDNVTLDKMFNDRGEFSHYVVTVHTGVYSFWRVGKHATEEEAREYGEKILQARKEGEEDE